MQSVMDRPLRERQAILDRLVAEAPAEGFPLGKSALKGRILALLPQRPFIDGALASREAHSEEDVAAAFEEAAKLEVGPFLFATNKASKQEVDSFASSLFSVVRLRMTLLC